MLPLLASASAIHLHFSAFYVGGLCNREDRLTAWR